MNVAWPISFAFVGLCVAIAAGAIFAPRSQPAPPRPDPQVACIEQRGKWIGSGWGMILGTCEFPPTTAAK